MTGGNEDSVGTGSYNFYYDSSTAGQLAKTFPYILSSSLLTNAIKAVSGRGEHQRQYLGSRRYPIPT